MTSQLPRLGPRTLLDSWNRLAGPFARFSMLGSTLLFALLGVASTAAPADIRPSTVLGILVVACLYHLFVYMLNDVVDLPIDRTAPQRQDSPMVQGVVNPRQVLTLALAQIPLALAITWWLAPASLAFATIITGFVLMAAYDVFGKRMAFPPVADLLQALGWGILVVYGSAVVSRPTALTFWLAAFVAAWTMQLNGLHGGLRDLENDYRRGARTTAILLGARPSATGGQMFTKRVIAYWYALQGAVAATILVALVQGEPGYGRWAQAVAVGLAVLLAGLGFAMIDATVRSDGLTPTMWSAGIVQLLATSCLPFAMLGHRLGAWTLLALLMVYFGPWLTSQHVRTALRWGWQWGNGIARTFMTSAREWRAER